MADRIEEITARLAAATPGPWRWGGNVTTRDVYLSTVHHGRVMVMTFDRWGMQGAGPTFWRKALPDVPRGWGGRQVKVACSAVREREYRGDIDHLDHPDAELIANAPGDIEFLLGEVKRLQAIAAAAHAGLVQCLGCGLEFRQGTAPHVACPLCGPRRALGLPEPAGELGVEAGAS